MQLQTHRPVCLEGEVSLGRALVAYFCLPAQLILKPKRLPPNGSFPAAVQPGSCQDQVSFLSLIQQSDS